MLCKSSDVIKFYNNYFSMMSESLYQSIAGKIPKILTPKQILQRLPIALAQVKSR